MPKKPQPARLSRTEWEIMRICWRLGRASTRQVLKHDRKGRDYRTILTFLSRMAKKGFLDVEKVRNTNYYSPALTHEQGLRREIKHFLTEVVGSKPEHLEMVQRALDRKKPRKSAKAKKRG